MLTNARVCKSVFGLIPNRNLTDAELAGATQRNIAAEEEAVHLYEAHADATDNQLAKKG